MKARKSLVEVLQDRKQQFKVLDTLVKVVTLSDQYPQVA